MLDRKILGFLDDGPLHGYELRRRICQLDGPGSTLSEGSLYPALRRLENAGFLTCSEQPGARGRTRRVLAITEAGRQRLHALLRSPSPEELTALPSFLRILAFLSHLPERADREAVLRRRLAIVQREAPAFFYDGGQARRETVESDPYRRGMIRIARAARMEEIAWLQSMLEPDAGSATGSTVPAGAEPGAGTSP